MKEKINRNAVFCSDIEQVSAQYPNLVQGADGKVWLAHQQYKDGHDALVVTEISKDGSRRVKTVETEGDVLQPVLYCFKGTVWGAWAEHLDQGWRIVLGTVGGALEGLRLIAAEGEAVFTPFLCGKGEALYVFYTEQHKESSRVMLATVQDGKLTDTQQVSASGMAYRPSACFCADGTLIIAYDRYLDGKYTIVTRACAGGNWGTETVVSSGEAWAASPEIQPFCDGALVIWYEIGSGSDFCYLTADLAVSENSVSVQNRQTIASSKGWYQNVALFTTESNTAVAAYTWDKYNIHLRIREGKGTWSDPIKASFDDGHCAIRPSVVVDNQKSMHIAWQFSYKNGHYYRNAAIIYNHLPLAELQEYEDEACETVISDFVKPVTTPKTRDKFDEAETKAWLKQNGYSGTLAFGDIHGQSIMSDGMGEVDQYFHAASDVADMDFTALTDHDTYTDWISESEWEFIRTNCRLMNIDGKRSTLLAYEWTPNEYRYDYGHKNVYYPTDEGEIFRSCDPSGLNPDRLFASIKPYGGMAIPHHVAALWGMVSAATDWSYHDESVQRISEVFSRHGSFEYYGAASKYSKNILQEKGSGVQDALARGYHLGLIAGSDSHQMEHGVEGGLLAAYVPSLTRKNVFNALYDRCVYAVTGDRILLSFRINGAEMGQIITAQTIMAEIHVNVKAPDDFDIELLKDNEVVARASSENKELDYRLEDALQPGETCYYVRVVEKNEQMAWSSPIWVQY